MAKDKQPQTADGLMTAEALRDKHKTASAVFKGVCASNNWGTGKMLTEAEYLNAVYAFAKGSIGGKGVK